MSAPFSWVPGGRGAWLADRFARADDGPLVALGDIVPPGYDAIVRILPPFTRDRPATGTFAEWEALADSADGAAAPEFLSEAVSWADTAAALGRELGETPRTWELLGVSYGEADDALAGDGWRYSSPSEGTLPAELFARIAGVLARHTATPDAGVAGVWEGYGGLVSAQGVGWFFAVPDPPRWIPRPLSAIGLRAASHVLSFRARSRRFGWRAAVWGLLLPGVAQRPGTGTLPAEAARGERLELPHRAYVCFAATPRDLAEPGWPARAPWVADDEFGDPQSPNVVWPDGREWVLVSEIDIDTTLVACSRACAEELLETAGIEAQLITRDTALF